MAGTKPLQKRRNPRQQRAEETIAHILEAATQVLEERGFEGATTNHIAKRAGVSIGTLYQYFPNKEALIAALFDKLVTKTSGLIEAELQSLAGTQPRAALQRCVYMLVELYDSCPQLVDSILTNLPTLGREEQFQATLQRLSALMLGFAQHFPGRTRSDLPLKLYVARTATETLLSHFVHEQPPYYTRDQLIAEFVTLMEHYLFGD